MASAFAGNLVLYAAFLGYSIAGYTILQMHLHPSCLKTKKGINLEDLLSKIK